MTLTETHGALTDHTFALPPGWEGGATFSEDGQFRYTLTRSWHPLMPGLPEIRRAHPDQPTYLAAIGTNPSAAGPLRDDMTVRLLALRAMRLGYYGLTVLNAYAYPATSPRELKARGYPVGPDNDAVIAEVTQGRAYDVLACWGAIPLDREAQLLSLLGDRPSARPVMCLGVTALGQPKHPLHQRRGRDLEPLSAFRVREGV